MKHFLAAGCLLAHFTAAAETMYRDYIDYDRNLSASAHWQADQQAMDSFIDGLLAKMTLAEKIGQLDLQAGNMATTGSVLNGDYRDQLKRGQVGAIFNAYGAENTRELQRIATEETRLGIPLLVGLDVIHGHRTIFPQSLGEAASWDLALIENNARIAAKEAAAEGINWTFAPMADVVRDPRWGRVSESAGEDPLLNSAMAVARVRGFQGDDLSRPDTVLATAKHFVGYGLSQAGRDYHTTDVSDYELWSTQLPAFKAMVDAGVTTFMTAFNDLNGIPATANSHILQTILREKWGFEGFVVSDYTAINELIPHGVARDEKHAAQLAFNAGTDMDMVGRVYLTHLEELVNEGKVKADAVDLAVRRVLEMKWRLGLFEDPYRYSDVEREKRDVLSEENLAAARDAARRTFVLLKNQDNMLPLKETALASIAVIGPLADDKRSTIGNWVIAGDGTEQPVTVREAFEARLGDRLDIHYAQGATMDFLADEATLAHRNDASVPYALLGDPDHQDLIDDAVEVAEKSDVIVMVLGEDQRMSGEASSRVSLSLPGNQQQLMEALKALGKPMVLVVMSARPNDLSWANEHVDAILHAWYPGTQGGHAIVDVLMGDYSPSGKLPMTFPRSVGQVPIYYNAKATGRPYRFSNPNQRQEHYKSRYDDSPNTPLYPFGFGLSYSKFNYGKMALSSDTLSQQGELTVSVTITNAGEMAAEEVVQLYTRQWVGSTTRPVKELKGFSKIALQPKESKEVTFTLTAKDLAFVRADGSWGNEPGMFTLSVGTSSVLTQRANFELLAH